MTLNTEERKTQLLGLLGDFWRDSRPLREKYARNQRLYLEQALGRESGRAAPRTGTPVL